MNWITSHLAKRTETIISPCWSLVCDVFEDRLGIKLNDYQINPKNHSAINEQFHLESQQWDKVDTPNIYDVVVMGRKDIVHHIGVSLGGEDVLHTGEGLLPRVEKLKELANTYRIIEFYRYGANS